MTPTVTFAFRMFLSGALTLGYWIATLFFLRFWRRSQDRLFALFAAAFFLLGIQRIALTGTADIVGRNDVLLWPYVIRLAAFAIILWAIIDKNRRE